MHCNSFFLSILIVVAMGYSCQSASEETSAKPQAPSTHEAHVVHEKGGHTVLLHNGERWEADTSTKAGIVKMQTLLQSYRAGATSDVDTLQKQLQQTFSQIFARCTMQGEAHTQLHNYLLPLKEQLSQLKTCGEGSCDTIIQTLDKHLQGFATYFK